MPSSAEGRAFAALLFVDIVGSTSIAAEMGDLRWRTLLDWFHATVRSELRRFGGREIDTAGDGSFSVFDAPGRAIRCAVAVTSAVRAHGLEVRVGVHSGEVERSGGTARGIAVVVAARVLGHGGAGEVIVTRTVRDVVAGSPVGFADAGTHELRGVPGQWHLFRVVELDGRPLEPPLAQMEASRRRDGVPEPRPARRRRAFMAVGGVVAVSTAVLWVALASTGGDTERTARTPPGVTQATPQPTDDEERLLSLLPSSFGPSCEPTSERPPGALAAVDCTAGEVQARYTLFGGASSMDEWFEGTVLNVAGAPPGDCGFAHVAVGEWSTGQAAAGRVVCYQEADDSWIEWTDERFLVLGQASRSDLGDVELHRWWLLEAGPWEKDGERRDGDPRISRFPEGTYRMRITQKDYEELGRSPSGVLHSWVGRWTLRVSDGEYGVASPDPTFDDRGFYVHGKDGWVLFYTTNTPACADDPDIYTWSVDDDRLMFRRPVPPPDCGGIQTNPPPWDVHRWQRME